MTILLVVSLRIANYTLRSLVEQTESRGLPIPFENFERVHIEESGTFHIFIEDYSPPTLSSHSFIFTNVANQAQTISRIPNMSVNYTPGVFRSYDIISDRYGRLVAIVDLQSGMYIVEFPPYEGSGIFVWGYDLNGDMFRFFTLVVIPVFIGFVSFGLNLILIIKYVNYRKRVRL